MAFRRVTPITVPWAEGSNKSDVFDGLGAVGFAIYIPSGWAAANLDFYGIQSGQPVQIFNGAGEALRLTGISTSSAGFYAVVSTISLGAGGIGKLQLFSRNTGDTDFVNQDIGQVVIYPS